MSATKTRHLTGAAFRTKGAPHGGVSIRTPRVPIVFSLLPGNIVRYGCPACRRTLYQDRGNPHPANLQRIERHVRLCEMRKTLLDILASRTRPLSL